MLRINVDDELDQASIRLEGNVAGIWIEELERAWRSANAKREGRPLRLDLSDVDRIEKAGCYLLALFHCFGTELIASGTFMIELVLGIEQNWPIRSRVDSRPTRISSHSVRRPGPDPVAYGSFQD